VAGKDEALLERRQNACSSWMWMPRRRILALGRGLCRDGVGETVPASWPMIV
jgi:hypothetical protein